MPPSRSASAQSTARRAPRPTASRPAPRAMALRSAAVRVRWERVGRVALLVVLLVVVGLYGEHTLSYFSTHARERRQQAVVDTLERQNRALQREQHSLEQPSTIVQQARRLGMVRPGEQPYAVTGQAGGG